MSERALTLARSGDEDAFRELTEPYRRELQLHCYRIVGSTQDAEDLVQETLLAAWRGLEQFKGSASIRTWLYRIATNRSLDALRANARRPQHLEPLTDPPTPSRMTEPIWLEPYPDALIEGIADEAPGPDARYDQREALALAFVTGLQHLHPQQRAVLVLRDVLGFRAAEAAAILDTSQAAVNSLLQRARLTLEGRLPAAWRHRAPLPHSPHEREVVGRFADALEDGDIGAVVTLLTDEAWLTMPPYPYEYQGRRGDRKLPPHPRRTPRRAAAARPHAGQRSARLRLLLPVPGNRDRARLRAARTHPRRQQDRRDHVFCRQRRAPPLRAPPFRAQPARIADPRIGESQQRWASAPRSHRGCAAH